MSREKPASGGLSIQTLLISSLSAVAAAIVVPLFWQKGTIVATAMTPIVVALANEALRRPAQHISSVAPRVTRRTATGVAVRRFDPAAAHTLHPERVGARGAGPERFEPVPGHEHDGTDGPRDDPFGLRKPPRRNWWRIGLVTGAVAFVIGAAVVTASELAVFGGSITGGNERTSLFGGTAHRSGQHSTKQQEQQTQPEATPTPATGGATPTPTTTAEPTTTPAPTETPTPTTSPPPEASPTP